MFCPSCGKEIADIAKVCGYCGFKMPLKDVPPPVSRTPVAEKKTYSATKASPPQKGAERPPFLATLRKIPVWLWGTMGGAIVILIVVIVIFSMGSGKPASINPVSSNFNNNSNTGSGASDVIDTANTSPIAGDWSGGIHSSDYSFSELLEVHIDSGCYPGETCGEYVLPALSVMGTLKLVRIDGDVYVFLEQPGGETVAGSGYEYMQLVTSDSIVWSLEQTLPSGEKTTTLGNLTRK